jgi:hypothetical protein
MDHRPAADLRVEILYEDDRGTDVVPLACLRSEKAGATLQPQP